MMDHCYQKNYKNFDWFIFYDVDEFIHLKNYTNIKDFLNEKKFNKCEKIYLNWVIHTDNNHYNYENISVQERFPNITEKNDSQKQNLVKTIVKGHLDDIIMNCRYKGFKKPKVNECNGYGETPEFIEKFVLEKQDLENYYIDHYLSKSVDEFIEKLNSDDMEKGDSLEYKDEIFEHYFATNNMTFDKLKYIEEKTKIDLSKYEKILNETK